MNMHKPETPLGQEEHHKPKPIHHKAPWIVAAVLTCAAVVCVAWLSVLVGLVPGPHVDYGPAPTPEDARVYLLEYPYYGQAEFLGYVRSEDDTDTYTGGRLPAGWVGYRFHEREAGNPEYGTNTTIYPCLYRRSSLEFNPTLVLTATQKEPGWYFLNSEGLSKYHNRCGQPGGIADFHNKPEGSAD